MLDVEWLRWWWMFWRVKRGMSFVTSLRITKKKWPRRRCYRKQRSWIYPVRTVWKQNKSLKKLWKTPLSYIKRLPFLLDIPICIKCLDELRRQQVIDEKMYDQKFIYNAVRKLALAGKLGIGWRTLIDSRTREILGSEVDCTRWKDKFSVSFIVFMDHKDWLW